ncbi:MAG: glycogen synthase GlgA [Planctomycetota bacterium]|nr:MAG: glycogen synthase GlgA [Planctomycetota bacterium]REJ89942.1 MAG: glycogen synthase GlgA [Planctomycetota bacterium]REK28174.1 MAG: glycogen synthase GlgA [Planctomycetota bacterium]REK42432.1 MAG: glycogen synthase GlgA [Planctomycetota bacterium]
MNVLIATSEAVPFAKTGGLADVCGALPIELARLGQEAALIMPAYRGVAERFTLPQPLDVELRVPIGNKWVAGQLLRTTLPESDVPVYLVRQGEYFDRDGIYGSPDGKSFRDNCERFVFFCRAVMEAIRLLDLRVDVLHTNDWTTGLIPALLKAEYQALPGYESIATLFTIHNLAYQGTFWHWDMLLTGLDWKYFNWRQMEFHGDLNLMKTGIVFADALNTVSPTYAREIQSAPLGCGLEDLLAHRHENLYGIINGVDDSQWNPQTDEHIAARYDVDSVAEGKAACKADLQRTCGLPESPRVPLIGFVGRLAEQKGIDLLVPLIQQWVGTHEAQWIVLGTGERTYAEQLQTLARRHPDRVAVMLEFSDPMAHRIEAGADMFVMPSRYEPCGLSQLYSLKYGTVPIVRATGGLVDTITDTNPETLRATTATGFQFSTYDTRTFAETVSRACDHYAVEDVWRQIVTTGMKQDWSWAASARQYVGLYQQLLARPHQAVSLP